MNGLTFKQEILFAVFVVIAMPIIFILAGILLLIDVDIL